ncbi:MAG: alkaline phosphatase family protein [Kofleriaceae bacterium]
MPVALATALVLVGIGLVGAIRAGLVGAAFMYDLELSRSPLASHPPLLADAPARTTRRVALVIVDGLRYDASRTMPQLARWRADGVDLRARSHYPSWSRPNYVSLLTGVPPVASGVRTNTHHTPTQLDTLMDRARAAGLRTATAADNEAMPKLFLRPPGGVDVPAGVEIDIDAMEDPYSEAALAAADFELVSPFDDARYAPWPGGLADAGRAELAGDYDLVVLLIGVVDQAGHAHGADSDEYRAATGVADRAVTRAVAGLDLARDTLIVVADHGHSDSGGHGGMEPEVLDVPLVLVGAGIRAGATTSGAELIDVAPTIAALLGMPPPGHGLGRALTEVLTLPPAQALAQVASDTARVARNQAIVDDALARGDAATQANRARRVATILGIAAVVLVAAFFARRRGGLRLTPRVLLIGVPAFFVVYYMLIGTVGQRFSPSLLPARGHLAWELAKYGAIGIAAHLASGWVALRGRAHFADRLAAANGVALAGLLLTIVPAALLWAYYPPPYVRVPGPALLVMIPAVQVAVACYATGIALTLVIEIVVFFARAVDPATRVERLERALARTRARLPTSGDDRA